MDTRLPHQVDTVIVGSGPSALILSYILHGNVPVYDRLSPHPDHILHKKLQRSHNLLDVDVDQLTEHFAASRWSYSTQALPINVLLDTLIRPLGETDDTEAQTCIEWQHDPSRAVSHIVVGDVNQAGGQWATDPVKAGWDVGTLSYAKMLSLPGYEFADFYEERYGRSLPNFLRPSRRMVADYLAIYPERVGIANAIHLGKTLSGIRRAGSGFYISSHKIVCKHLVLASGVFTSPVMPSPQLSLLRHLPRRCDTISAEPILVIGSGFSAADVILSAKPEQKIIHLYKWSPSKAPSPLKACHPQAYPEYAGIYRKMKLAAASSKLSRDRRPVPRRAPSSTLDFSRDWSSTYEGLSNTNIVDVESDEDGDGASITFQRGDEAPFVRRVSSLAYVVGRRGSLGYLEPALRQQICPDYDEKQGLSGRNLREQANVDLEVTDNVFIIGSLTGDTLVRYSYGGCTYAARKIMEHSRHRTKSKHEPQTECYYKHRSKAGDCFVPLMIGLDGHAHKLDDSDVDALPLDRRKLARRE